MRINWRHPLANGLRFLYLPVTGLTFDLAKNRLPTGTSGTFTRSVFSPGVGSDHTSNRYVTYAAPGDIGNAFTIFSHQSGPTTIASSESPVDSDYNFGVRVFQFRTDGFIWFNTTGTPFFATPSALSSLQKTTGWTQSAKVGPSNTTGSCTVDGVRTTGDTTSGTIQSISSGPGIRIGASFVGGASQYFTGYIHLACIWGRVLSNSEELALHYDPYCFLEPDIAAPWFVGASGSYSMAAEAGSFTLTGNAAGTTASRLLTGGTGAFTLTGVNAGLTAARLLTGGTGAFTLTGNDAALSKAVTMTAETGAFTFTGMDVGFSRALALQAGVGEFDLTGNAARLDYSGAAQTGGGWVDPRVARKLIRQAKAYQRSIEERREDRERRENELLRTMERTYAEITGEPLPDDIEVVAERIAESPPVTPMDKVADAIAVYALVAPMRDETALAEAYEALDRALMQARLDTDDARILAMAQSQDAELLGLMKQGAEVVAQMLETTNAALRL